MILNGSKLKDNYINAFHNIAKVQFPLIRGFHNSLLLNKTLLNLEDYEQSLQMLFIPDRSHWAVLQVVKWMFTYMTQCLHHLVRILKELLHN